MIMFQELFPLGSIFGLYIKILSVIISNNMKLSFCVAGVFIIHRAKNFLSAFTEYKH